MAVSSAPGSSTVCHLSVATDDGVAFEAAGVAPGNLITYVMFDSGWESGQGVYSNPGGTAPQFTRDTVQSSSNSNTRITAGINTIVYATAIVSGPGPTVPASVSVDADPTLAANSDSRIATQKATKAYVDARLPGLAGDGITILGDGTIKVQASGSTLNVTSSGVSVNSAVVAMKSSGTIIGDGVTRIFPIDHGLATSDIIVSVRDLGANRPVWVDWAPSDDDTVVITFVSPPIVDAAYLVRVMG